MNMKIKFLVLAAVSLLFVTASGNDPNKRSDPDAANWDIATLDTAADADYLTGIEKDVILEMNKVRTDPKKYAKLYLQPRLKYYQKNNYMVPGEITLITKEGAKAVKECIKALNKTKSMGILKPEKGLYLAAKDHVKDQGKTGQTGHTGSDKSSPKDRIVRHGSFGSSWSMAENIAYGSVTGRDIVVDLLIDDGVKNRGHRVNILNGDFTQTGAAYGEHAKIRTTCTIVYARGFISK